MKWTRRRQINHGRWDRAVDIVIPYEKPVTPICHLKALDLRLMALKLLCKLMGLNDPPFADWAEN